MANENISLEELRARLAAAGIPFDQGWGDAGGNSVRPAFIERQGDALRSIRKLLMEQVEKDKALLTELHAAKIRTKHGGGV